MILETSLFDSFNARFLRPSQIAQHFVIPSHFSLVCERNHSVIIGPRGSGKTTLLKMLQISALKSWHPKERGDVIARVDFTAIYVAADSSWSSLFVEPPDFTIAQSFRDMLVSAVLNVYVQFAVIDTIEELFGADLLDDEALRRFYLSREKVEAELSLSLANIWMISGPASTIFILRAKLSERLNDLALLADRIKFGQCESIAKCVEQHPFLSLKYDFLLRNTISAINGVVQQPDRKWCICLDELEIVPEHLRVTLFRALRSSDQRLLFKMSLSPFSIDLFEANDTTFPMPGQDYTPIYLSYPRSSDAVRFGRELAASLSRDIEMPESMLNSVFGHSTFAAAEPNVSAPIATYQAPGGERYRLFAELEKIDPTFREFLRSRRYDIRAMPAMPENRRAQLRKLLQICRARIEFRQFRRVLDEINAGSGHQGFRRSRKRIHEMYTGLEALLTICEGNPRWIIGILRPLLQRYKISLQHGNRSRLSASSQTAQILSVITRYRSLLTTIPVKQRGRKDVDVSALRMIDQIGDYMFRDVVLGPFKPEPVLSFIVDRSVSESEVQALGTAINQGAFVLVPSRKGEATYGTIRHSRFRMSYLLAPYFQLPLTFGAPKNLSGILRNGTDNTQMSLEDL
jgi:hypothetical protein